MKIQNAVFIGDSKNIDLEDINGIPTGISSVGRLWFNTSTSSVFTSKSTNSVYRGVEICDSENYSKFADLRYVKISDYNTAISSKADKTVATTSTDGLLAATDKIKLNNLNLPQVCKTAIVSSNSTLTLSPITGLTTNTLPARSI